MKREVLSLSLDFDELDFEKLRDWFRLSDKLGLAQVIRPLYIRSRYLPMEDQRLFELFLLDAGWLSPGSPIRDTPSRPSRELSISYNQEASQITLNRAKYV